MTTAIKTQSSHQIDTRVFSSGKYSKDKNPKNIRSAQKEGGCPDLNWGFLELKI